MQFVTTETRRPELIARSCKSFAANLKGVDFRDCTLFANIDPVPRDASTEATIKEMERWFGKVVVRTPKTPNFASAFRWCISQPDDPFFFSYEMDWILEQEVHIDWLVEEMMDNESLACVNLRAYCFEPHDKRICLSPGLWRTSAAKIIASRMVDEANPEAQLRAVSRGNPHGGKHEGFVGQQFPHNPLCRMIVDIGRPWLATTKYRRPKDTGFITWIG